jgi:hypothetical protein
MVPFPQDAKFVGRENVLDRIIKRVNSESHSHTRVALVGLGGIG